MKNISETLKNIRKNVGITQKQVADGVGIAVVSYARYEIGERTPTLDIAVKLADFFKVTLDELVGRDFEQ